ncbi:signal recognition particle protein [Rothia sp. BD8]|uniref:Signal recognition particle protein n=1 Tax=Rothia kristinae TaxID=37923 RepID=A0A199NS73_9MICC|nr:signal recognition particle protein [Rothia kristinae]MBG7587904.1 signal recognition particle protein [Rothia kristinae]MED6045920.1 signal recognition particle protein [Rothia kristinae]OAX51939.1 signal recognition particle protein [Rothia kristinae]QQC59431.1 signal recognition particle protein [Rothia kristinae]SQC29195.1 Fifty-four homolog [Rothia kristinae]
MFNSLSDRLAATFKNLRGKGRLSEADVDATVREIRRALLDADVAVPVVREFTGAVKQRALGAEVSEALNPGQQVVKIVNDELKQILGGQTRRIRMAKTGPTIIMLAGLQGAGKTTLAGKLAHWLSTQGHKPILVASDLQRPNAVTQLQVVGQRAGVPVFAPHPGTTSEFDDPTGDPVQVARDGVAEARAKLHDVVIVDTAGRLGVDQELMKQARDIRDAIVPNEVLFVIDAMIGQDAVNTALAFDEGVDFTGVVLSKLDGDARGGAALSVASVTGKPIMFASTGEGVKDFEQFHPDRMADRILDMGDVLTLIEQAEASWDKAEADRMAKKFQDREDFTFEDFLAQMQQIRKMGSMKKLLMMMPGAAQMRQQLENFDEKEIDRVEAIVRSMTPHERVAPKIINGSRRARIARGSGVTVSEVNQLMERFGQAQKLMKRMAGGKGMPGMPGMQGMPGMPGMGGPGGGSKKKAKGKNAKRKGSGNPAKREAQRKGLQQPAAARGSSFGQQQKQDLDLSNLPKGFEKFLGDQ